MYDAIADDPRLEETRAVYRRIFEVEALGGDANDFMSRLEEADLVCALARTRQLELAKDGLEHCAGLSQPHLEYHYNTLHDTVLRCTSRTEIEHEVARLEACNAVENAWNHIFLHYALRTATTAMIYELNRSADQRATVQKSYAAITTIFGVDWETLMSSPRVQQFFDEVIFTRGQRLIDQDKQSKGLYHSEVGLGLIQQLRDDALLHVTDYVKTQGHNTVEEMKAHAEELVNSQRHPSAEQMRAHVSAMFAAAMDEVGGPDQPRSPAPHPLIYWGKEVALADLCEVLSSPPRPC
jgi:hypothetical protein